MNIKSLLSALTCFLGKNRKKASRRDTMAAFRRRYLSFKELLEANARLASIMTNLNRVQQCEAMLETSGVRKQARRAVVLSKIMAKSLNAISDNSYPALLTAADKIGEKIYKELTRHVRGDVKAITLPLSDIDSSMAYIAGNKSANLGEMRNILNLSVPRGFAISAQASAIYLLRDSELFQKIFKHLSKVDVDKPHTIKACARTIAAMLAQRPFPQILAEAILKAWDETFGSRKYDAKAAVRSSAMAEDGAQSFAGQYKTVLGATRETLLEAVGEVIGSLYSESAIAYRAAHGYPLDATGMGICCVEMIDAKASGAAFSRHPIDLRSNNVVINGVWGLGEMLVDGLCASDQWIVSRGAGKIRQKTIAHKPTCQKLASGDNDAGIHTAAIPLDLQDAPCLTDEQAIKIAEAALALEHHYQYPQDIEWTIDANDRIFFLQSRPLGLDTCNVSDADCANLAIGGNTPLVCGGEIASKGVACGITAHIYPNQDLTHFPDGAVLVTENSSPNMMHALRKAGAVIAEKGSLTGHMASLCREFRIPAILNLQSAMTLIPEGQLLTVDAITGRIFAGEIPELLALRLPPRHQTQTNTPALALLRHIAPLILPLRLIDPRSELFEPQNCTSIHDIMRYAHEKSYTEMFRISDRFSESGASGVASKLLCKIPLDLYVIDLGGGLADASKPEILPEDVLSAPFNSVLEGMLAPEVQPTGPRPVNIKGFLSVMEQSLIGANLNASERFGDRSYAIISDRYLNLSSRVGYHYAVLDSWAGATISKNYIRFEFAGGAAGHIQRSRRARCIGHILSELGFTVDVWHDRVRAGLQKFARNEILSRLNQIGRLLIVTRQMDMLMVDDNAVQSYAAAFLRGEYH